MEELTIRKVNSWDSAMKSLCAKLHFWSYANWKKTTTEAVSELVLKNSGLEVEEDNPDVRKGTIISSLSIDDQPAYPNCDLSIWLRTCEKEVISPLQGITTGIIPSWLNGSLYRNGPGKQYYGRQTVNHLFDASGLLHLYVLFHVFLLISCCSFKHVIPYFMFLNSCINSNQVKRLLVV